MIYLITANRCGKSEALRQWSESYLNGRAYQIFSETAVTKSQDKTIRELQSGLPWTAHYHRDFRSSPMTHKDFAHALLHVHKAGGKLAAIINDAEHGGVDWADPKGIRLKVTNYVADFVVCALRMANTCPEGLIDLQEAVETRITGKNNQLAAEAAAMRKPNVEKAEASEAIPKPKAQVCGINQYRSLAMNGPCTVCGASMEAHLQTTYLGSHGDEDTRWLHVIFHSATGQYYNQERDCWDEPSTATIFESFGTARYYRDNHPALRVSAFATIVRVVGYKPTTFRDITEGGETGMDRAEKFTGRGENCRNGHRPSPTWVCLKCGKQLGHADGVHVHDPRGDKA